MKQLTKENWLEVDPIVASGLFVRPSMTDQTIVPVTPEDHVERILIPQLAPSVPPQIRDLYEVARGAMLYGTRFYPLFTLGLEQVARVAEAAAMAKATLVGIPLGRRTTFSRVLDDLLTKDILTKKEHAEWSLIRELRNIASHPSQQTILPPGEATHILRSFTATMNRLFS
jgi:hypothetical protein